MKHKHNILVVGAGGVAGIGLTKCLETEFSVYGKDDSDWSSKVMRAKKHAKEPIDLCVPVPDSLVLKYAGKKNTLLPKKSEIALCQDKAACAKILGNLAPKTYWVRDTHGAGGAGAQMASEYLPGRNFSCEVVYFHGEILGHFVKERLSYSVKGTDLPLDKRGSSAVSICRKDDLIAELALEAVNRVAKKPHGAWGIDFKENEEKIPLITEVNAGRFLTASYVYFYMTDYNLPLKLFKAYFDEDYTLGEYPANKGIIRQTDSLPWIGEL